MKTHARRWAGYLLFFLLSVTAPYAFAYTVTQTRYDAEFEVSASFFDIDSGAVIASDSSSDSVQGSVNGPLPWTDVLSLNVNPVLVNGNWVQASVSSPGLGLSHNEESTYDDSLYIVDMIGVSAEFLLQTYCHTSSDCSSADKVNAVTADAFQIAVEQDFNLVGPATIDFGFQPFFVGGQNTTSLTLKDINGNLLLSLAGESNGLFSSQNLLAGSYTVSYSWGHSDSVSAVLGYGFGVDGGGEAGQAYFSAFITPQPVPIPAAAWLFATGLISLVGISCKKRRN
jgi:hypothetical protein